MRKLKALTTTTADFSDSSAILGEIVERENDIIDDFTTAKYLTLQSGFPLVFSIQSKESAIPVDTLNDFPFDALNKLPVVDVSNESSQRFTHSTLESAQNSNHADSDTKHRNLKDQIDMENLAFISNASDATLAEMKKELAAATISPSAMEFLRKRGERKCGELTIELSPSLLLKRSPLPSAAPSPNDSSTFRIHERSECVGTRSMPSNDLSAPVPPPPPTKSPPKFTMDGRWIADDDVENIEASTTASFFIPSLVQLSRSSLVQQRRISLSILAKIVAEWRRATNYRHCWFGDSLDCSLTLLYPQLFSIHETVDSTFSSPAPTSRLNQSKSSTTSVNQSTACTNNFHPPVPTVQKTSVSDGGEQKMPSAVVSYLNRELERMPALFAHHLSENVESIQDAAIRGLEAFYCTNSPFLEPLPTDLISLHLCLSHHTTFLVLPMLDVGLNEEQNAMRSEMHAFALSSLLILSPAASASLSPDRLMAHLLAFVDSEHLKHLQPSVHAHLGKSAWSERFRRILPCLGGDVNSHGQLPDRASSSRDFLAHLVASSGGGEENQEQVDDFTFIVRHSLSRPRDWSNSAHHELHKKFILLATHFTATLSSVQQPFLSCQPQPEPFLSSPSLKPKSFQPQSLKPKSSLLILVCINQFMEEACANLETCVELVQPLLNLAKLMIQLELGKESKWVRFLARHRTFAIYQLVKFLVKIRQQSPLLLQLASFVMEIDDVEEVVGEWMRWDLTNCVLFNRSLLEAVVGEHAKVESATCTRLRAIFTPLLLPHRSRASIDAISIHASTTTAAIQFHHSRPTSDALTRAWQFQWLTNFLRPTTKTPPLTIEHVKDLLWYASICTWLPHDVVWFRLLEFHLLSVESAPFYHDATISPLVAAMSTRLHLLNVVHLDEMKLYTLLHSLIVEFQATSYNDPTFLSLMMNFLRTDLLSVDFQLVAWRLGSFSDVQSHTDRRVCFRQSHHTHQLFSIYGYLLASGLVSFERCPHLWYDVVQDWIEWLQRIVRS